MEEAKKIFNGTETFCRVWKPVSTDAKCLVFISHGFGEHSDRYTKLADLLTIENMLVFCHDHKGFGRSAGRRAWIKNMDDDLVNPIKMHIDEIRARYPGKKMFLYAHSMGGLVAARLVELHPNLVNGVILEAPFLGTGVPGGVTDGMLKVVRFMGRSLGSLPMAKVASRDFSRDAEVVADIDKDPLTYHGSTSAKTAAAMMNTVREVVMNANSFFASVLICHGDADKVAAHAGSEAFFKLAASTDKTYMLLPGGFHQLRSELDDVKQPFLAAVVQWINARC